MSIELSRLGFFKVNRSESRGRTRDVADKKTSLESTLPKESVSVSEGANEPKTTSPGLLGRLRRRTGKWAVYGMLAVIGFNALGPAMAQSADALLHEGHKTEIMAPSKNLTREQSDLAEAELDLLGNGTVALLADQNVKLHVTQNDAETAKVLTEKMGFTEVTPKALSEVGPKARAVGESLTQNDRVAQLETTLDSLHQERTTELQKLQKERFAQVQTQRPMGGLGGLMAGGHLAQKDSANLPMTGLGGQLIKGGMSGGPMGGMGMMGMGNLPESLVEINNRVQDSQQMLTLITMQSIQEANLQGMVKPAAMLGPGFTVETAVMMSGAQTPAEKAEYRDLIYEINGERMEQAQSEGLASMEKNLARMTNPQAREFFSQSLKAAKENPDQIPVQSHKNSLLLPSIRYNHFEGQQEGESFRSLADQDISFYVQGAAGLFNNPTRYSQVDANALQPDYGVKVVVHEMGHAIDKVMEDEYPDFHKDWHARVRTAYDSAAYNQKHHGQEVNSEYGMTNHKEYVAEGLERMMSAPEHLQETDPALYKLTLELLNKANEAGTSRTSNAVRASALAVLAAPPQAPSVTESRNRDSRNGPS